MSEGDVGEGHVEAKVRSDSAEERKGSRLGPETGHLVSRFLDRTRKGTGAEESTGSTPEQPRTIGVSSDHYRSDTDPVKWD